MWFDYQIDFGHRLIEFINYPYPSASVHPRAALKCVEIKEVDPKKFPLEIRLVSGETLFIPGSFKNKLIQFAERNLIPIIARVNVWELLLEIFLDKEFTEEEEQKTLNILEENGIDTQLASEIRVQVQDVMRSYNFDPLLWEEAHLGLADLLAVLMGRLVGEEYKLSPDEYDAFYHRAMEISRQAKPVGV